MKLTIKKQFTLLIVVLLIGSLVIYFSNFLSVNNRKMEVTQEKVIQNETQKKFMQEFDLKPDKAKMFEQQEQLVIQGKNKMYFEDIEQLDLYFKTDQLEDIKQKVQSYVHLYISNELIECVLKTETLKQVDNKIFFELDMENVKRFEVQVTKDIDNKIVDITILNSL